MLDRHGILLALCATLLLSAGAHAEAGLVARYDFGEGSGTVVADKSGNGCNGKIAGGQWMKGKGNFALLLDGVKDYVDCGSGKALNLSGSMTVSLWVLPREAAGKPHESYALAKDGYNITLDPNGTVNFKLVTGRTVNDRHEWLSLSSKGRAPRGEWTLVTAVYDQPAKEERIYLNGQLDNVRKHVEQPDIFAVEEHKLLLGCNSHAQPADFFRGMLADVRVYDRPLSGDEIRLLAQSGSAAMTKEMQAVLDVNFRPFPYFVGKNLRVNLDLGGLTALEFKPALSVQYADCADGKVLQSRTLETLAALDKAVVLLPAADVKPGEYEITARLLGLNKEVLASRSFKIPKYPSGSYIGLTRVPEERPVTPPPAELILRNETIECAISPLTGQVTGIRYLPRNVALVEKSADVYLFREKDAPRLSEEQDRVTGYRAGAEGKPGGFELVCTNPGLPDIEMTKAYRMEADRLVKVVYFRATSDRNDGELIFLRSTLRMPQEFYRDGYLYRPMWDGGGWVGRGAVPFVAGNSITDHRPLKDLDAGRFIYVQPKLDIGLAHYKHKVNGHLDNPKGYSVQSSVIEDRGFLDPQGWDAYFTGEVVREGYFLSCESHFMVFQGDARQFHEHDLALPDLAAMARSKVPDWWRKVKSIGGFTYDQLEAGRNGMVLDRSRHVLAGYGPDEYLLSCIGDFMTGDYRTEGSFNVLGRPPKTQMVTADEVRANLSAYRQIDPERLKLSLYTWYSSASDKSTVYMKEHPEWLLRNDMGALLQNGAGETYNYTLNDVTQQQKDFTKQMYANMQKGYRLDFTYKDGDNTEAVNFFPEKNYRHNYHAQIAYRAMKLTAEENGYAHFINGSCFPDYSHGGYFEYGGELDYFDKVDWRIAANVAYVARRYMPPPLISCLLYWTDTARSNRYVMYGTTPHLGMLWADMDTCHSFLTTELAFEEKDAELIVNDAVHPNWWKFETETLESALLKSGKSYILPLINHDAHEKSENIEVRLAGLEINPAAPVYLWQIQPLIPRGYDYTAHIPEKRATVAYQLQVLSADQGALKIAATALRANQPKILLFGQLPAYVYSVNGRRSNLLLCSSRGVTIEGKSEGDSVALSVQNEEPAAELLVLLREGASNAAATVNGEAAPCELLRFGERLFAKVAVPKGTSQVVARATAGNPQVAALESPARDCYKDYALWWYPERQDPTIVADKVDGVACWKLIGPGVLYSPFNRGDFKSVTKGVAFRLNGGQAKGKVLFSFGEYARTIPLDFAGWKEFVIMSDQFDSKPKQVWGASAQFKFEVPDGSVYVSDLRLIPTPPEERVAVQPVRQKAEIPYVNAAPLLDGELNDEIWTKAVKLETPDKQTTYYVAYDDKNLYVAARCLEGIVALPSKPARGSHQCFQPPNVEFYFVPKDIRKIYQFAVTAGGGQANVLYSTLDAPIGEEDWTGTWKAATGFGYNLSWQAEVVIPFSDLGGKPPQKGDIWLGGFFRQGGISTLSGWNYKGGSWRAVDTNYGELLFSGK